MTAAVGHWPCSSTVSVSSGDAGDSTGHSIRVVRAGLLSVSASELVRNVGPVQVIPVGRECRMIAISAPKLEGGRAVYTVFGDAANDDRLAARQAVAAVCQRPQLAQVIGVVERNLHCVELALCREAFADAVQLRLRVCDPDEPGFQ